MWCVCFEHAFLEFLSVSLHVDVHKYKQCKEYAQMQSSTTHLFSANINVVIVVKINVYHAHKPPFTKSFLLEWHFQITSIIFFLPEFIPLLIDFIYRAQFSCFCESTLQVHGYDAKGLISYTYSSVRKHPKHMTVWLVIHTTDSPKYLHLIPECPDKWKVCLHV